MSNKTESPLIAKLKKAREDAEGFDELVLPNSKVRVTWPKFKPHALMMKATRLARTNKTNALHIYTCLLCEFDGEKLKYDDAVEYLSAEDWGALLGAIQGDDDDEDDEGALKN